MSLPTTLLMDFRVKNPEIYKDHSMEFPMLSQARSNWKKVKSKPDFKDVDFKEISFEFSITSELIDCIEFASKFAFCIEAYSYQCARVVERIVPSKKALICTRLEPDAIHQTSIKDGMIWSTEFLPVLNLEIGCCYWKQGNVYNFSYGMEVGFIEI